MNPGLADDPLVDHRPEMQDLSGPELNESEVNRVAEVVGGRRTTKKRQQPSQRPGPCARLAAPRLH